MGQLELQAIAQAAGASRQIAQSLYEILMP